MEIVNLLRDYEQVTRAIQAFDAGGRIVSMSVATSPLTAPMLMAAIDVSSIAYPPQMTDTIKASLNARRQQIADELKGLGISGLGQH